MVTETEVLEGNHDGLECKRAKVHESFVRGKSVTGGTVRCTVRSRERPREQRNDRVEKPMLYDA